MDIYGFFLKTLRIHSKEFQVSIRFRNIRKPCRGTDDPYKAHVVLWPAIFLF